MESQKPQKYRLRDSERLLLVIRRKKKVFDKSGKHEKFKEKVWLASPTMHGEELQYMQEAYDTNWMSTIGVNINEVETQIAEKVGTDHAVALATGTASIHLSVNVNFLKN